jgi:hypothetical protein
LNQLWESSIVFLMNLLFQTAEHGHFHPTLGFHLRLFWGLASHIGSRCFNMMVNGDNHYMISQISSGAPWCFLRHVWPRGLSVQSVPH